MLAAKYKISSEQFKQYYNKGRKKNSLHMRFNFVFQRDINQAHFAVVISKKIAKNAVDRNKQRRRIYNILSETYPHFCKGFLCFIFIQKDIAHLSFQEIQAEIQTVFYKEGLLR